MNTLLQISANSPFRGLEGKKWYFLSVFYARENWSELITMIMQYYRKQSGLFHTYLFSFSTEKGEHVRVTFASPDDDSNYTDEIQADFQMFLEQCPSYSTVQFPYGKALWGNYPNNSLAWNKFRLLSYSEQYIRFHQQTMRLALNLMENDFSEETIFAIGMYLFTKGLSCIDSKEQRSALSQVLEEALLDNSNDMDTIQKLVDEIDIHEARETIESYWSESIPKHSALLTEWLNEANDRIKQGYNNFCSVICNMFGLSSLHEVLILKLLNIWYNTKQNANA